jgi:hypothetical protein
MKNTSTMKIAVSKSSRIVDPMDHARLDVTNSLDLQSNHVHLYEHSLALVA